MRHNPLAVASWFCDKAEQEGALISPLKLNYLMFLAYAWGAGCFNDLVFDDQIKIRPNGPVVYSIYEYFLKNNDIDLVFEDFCEETRLLLERVWQVYNKFTASQLQKITLKIISHAWADLSFFEIKKCIEKHSSEQA